MHAILAALTLERQTETAAYLLIHLPLDQHHHVPFFSGFNTLP